jgi:hypothetical protein
VRRTQAGLEESAPGQAARAWLTWRPDLRSLKGACYSWASGRPAAAMYLRPSAICFHTLTSKRWTVPGEMAQRHYIRLNCQGDPNRSANSVGFLARAAVVVTRSTGLDGRFDWLASREKALGGRGRIRRRPETLSCLKPPEVLLPVPPADGLGLLGR